MPEFTTAPQTSVTGGMEHLHARLERIEEKLDLIATDVSKLRDNLVPYITPEGEGPEPAQEREGGLITKSPKRYA